MKLSELLEVIPGMKVHGNVDRPVNGLQYDSRRVQKDEIFFAWKGDKTDGQQFIPQVLDRGAAAVVVDRPWTGPHSGATLIEVPDVRRALAKMAAAFQGNPSEKMSVVGVTGTNGKTTTSFLLKHILEKSGRRSGLIGTVRYEIGERILPSSRTTPEGNDLQELFAQMVEAGASAVVMEVSSHALDQGRVEGTQFEVALFTNLTQDHLDYHGTMESYFDAKGLLFKSLGRGGHPGTAVVNLDDPQAEALLAKVDVKAHRLTFSVEGNPKADLRADKIVCHTGGSQFDLVYRGATFPMSTSLIGMFNVENVLAAIGGALALGVSTEEIIDHLEDAPKVPGRLETFYAKNGMAVVVDYAHTEDALRKTLQTLRDLNPSRLVVVIGCGGSRDIGKRPRMAQVAVELADLAIFTSDNPRNEPAETILEQMEAGVRGVTNFRRVEDRREAIAEALQSGGPADVVCIAGKGHETTQEVGGRFLPFDDRLIVQELLNLN